VGKEITTHYLLNTFVIYGDFWRDTDSVQDKQLLRSTSVTD